MRFLKFNSRGAGTAVMFFAFFTIMLIIGGGIFWGVSSFFGRGIDFRDEEAFMIANYVSDCIRNYVDYYNFFSDEDIYSECGLSEKVIEDGRHFVMIKKINSDEKKLWGVGDFENTCQFE